MSRKYYGRISTFGRTWGHKTHKTWDNPVFNLLQTINPQKLVGTKLLDQWDKFFTFVGVINGLVRWNRGDFDRACVSQQTVSCP